ncbi:MAG TPA: lipoyl(octanoyl) transferase LipB [Alphaproteobacteria bacterium]|nr:lipoyl(octanoyl) transferase LipB [Alphaproteobacteria bacterium]
MTILATSGPQTPVDWTVAPDLTPYREAVETMEARVAAIHAAEQAEQVWLVEHPPLYTAGTSAKPSDLLEARFPVHETGRGGQLTYHGPGQRVAYVMLDLKRRNPDVRAYVAGLEAWIMAALATFGVNAERREGRVGLWVALERHGGLPGTEAKIAAIGVRVRRWITFHGAAINLAPDLSHYGGIVPCGIREHGVTSLKALGVDATMDDLDAALKAVWPAVFG